MTSEEEDLVIKLKLLGYVLRRDMGSIHNDFSKCGDDHYGKVYPGGGDHHQYAVSIGIVVIAGRIYKDQHLDLTTDTAGLWAYIQPYERGQHRD